MSEAFDDSSTSNIHLNIIAASMLLVFRRFSQIIPGHFVWNH